MGVGGAMGVMSWVTRKYGRVVVAGVLSASLIVNLTLHAGSALHYYCSNECLEALLTAPILTLDHDAVVHIRENWVDPPAPRDAYKPSFPLDEPPWTAKGSWSEAYTIIKNYFKQYEVPGTFVEVGAADGEFQSLTLWVEQQLGFRGLLVEPNPQAYQALRAAGRSAYSIQACATPDEGHRKDMLWIRNNDADLPSFLRQLQKGSNRLWRYVPVEDRDLGRTVPVQCFNLGALVVAALRSVTVDLLVVSTHGGEIDILRSIPHQIKVKVLVVVAPIVTGEDMDELSATVHRWRLAPALTRHDINIFVPQESITHA
ncbi:uncharacterized protein LOC123519951 [Portunus trituberculatus]|uniref:uncharacterized protein LOC123519951 n=1 Tax=Portunus trituberculatus TaxID=210409 RepID=UPI001E1CF3F7|nr:uncharacterized protein LOC123519951 [Portunus trituberculatus]XP_045137630.1 uncharacterized protein LOC123519951 [Portunus trituberculatus]